MSESASTATHSPHDIWSEWLLNRRFGGDKQRMQQMLEDCLYPIRDKVLKNAAIHDGDHLLDVGCGDGLIAFGALEKSAAGKVILSDISQDLLDHVRDIAQQMAVINRCEFLNAPADDLSALADTLVNVVTTRSVLIYVAAKEAAFKEFYRVLKPGGRLSIFEPINRFAYPEPPDRFCGYDVSEIAEIAQKVKAIFARIQPVDTDPMLNFDERDLLVLAEKAGFKEIHLELTADITRPDSGTTWDEFLHTAGNPKIPTLAEAMQQALTPYETAALMAHLRPLVEARQGVQRSAIAYLWAVKW